MHEVIVSISRALSNLKRDMQGDILHLIVITAPTSPAVILTALGHITML
jgi:hypothetical protein